MVLRRTETGWAVLAPAKLNLFLEVLGRRDDGYHEVETLNVPVHLYDELFLRPTFPPSDSPARFELQVLTTRESEPLPGDESNLVIRALGSLALRSGCGQGAAVVLRKRIPMKAGLGGGSSDAAAALLAANAAWGLHWSLNQLADLGAEIGSDVPYFVRGGAAICRGRGERIEQVSLPARLPCVIVHPPMGLGTAEVYARLDASPAWKYDSGSQRVGQLLSALRSGDWRLLARRLHNSLQSAADGISPWVDRLATAFGQLPFVAHQLTGSGSAYFGLCRNYREAKALASLLTSRNLGRVFVTTTGS